MQCMEMHTLPLMDCFDPLFLGSPIKPNATFVQLDKENSLPEISY